VLRRLLILVLVGLLLVFGGRALLLTGAAGTPDAAEPNGVTALKQGERRTAIVFGAGLNRQGEPSALLRDRVRAAESLWRSGKVDQLLMTGDNSRTEYSEPSAMRALAIADGIPATSIALDYGGRRSWDSCKRAKDVFGVEQAIVVTNDFHRARTVVLCRAADIEVVGAVGTTTGVYAASKRAKWYTRETVASWRGAIDAWVKHPSVPVGGEPIDAQDPCAVWRSLNVDDRRAAPGKPDGC
jgi:SanA protein